MYNLVSKYPAPSPITHAPTIKSIGHFSNVYKYPSLVSSLLLLAADLLLLFPSPLLFPFQPILLLGCTGAQSFWAVMKRLLWLGPPPILDDAVAVAVALESMLARDGDVRPFWDPNRSSVDGEGSGADRALAKT